MAAHATAAGPDASRRIDPAAAARGNQGTSPLLYPAARWQTARPVHVVRMLCHVGCHVLSSSSEAFVQPCSDTRHCPVIDVDAKNISSHDAINDNVVP